MDQITSPTPTDATTEVPVERELRADSRRADRAQRIAAAVEAAHLLQIRSR